MSTFTDPLKRLLRTRCSGAAVHFVGRGLASSASEALVLVVPPRPGPISTNSLSWLEQIHSDSVVHAHSGNCGRADALVTTEPNLALTVVTADCLPVVIASESSLAVVHAGWRGLVAGVIPNAVRYLEGEAQELKAWIGPAIGPCCFEVESDVAHPVAAASAKDVIREAPGERPHIDLPLAAQIQLREVGVHQIDREDICTKCHSDRFWSYRQDGPGAGRNYCLAWLESTPEAVLQPAG